MTPLQAFLSSTLLVCMFIWVGIIIVCSRGPFLRFLVFCQFILTLIAITYESRYMGCGLYDCEPKTNKHSLPQESFACVESERVNWRRAEILSFLCFLVLFWLDPTDVPRHLVFFVIAWAILYFYFNFDQYHRSSIACRSITQ